MVVLLAPCPVPERTAAARYEAAELDLADRFARDRTSYVQVKEPIVGELLVTARAWRDEVIRHGDHR